MKVLLEKKKILEMYKFKKVVCSGKFLITFSRKK